MHSLGHLLEERLGELVVGGKVCQVDGDQDPLGLGVDVTDIDTPFVREEQPVSLSSGSE